MQDNPLVCTLSAADYRDRETAWLKLKTFLIAAELVPGGLSFSFTRVAGLKDSLTELVRLEAECCAWMTFAMAESFEGIALSITSNSAEGERGVRETFAPLTVG
jgi:hypothetical protein